jgi:hypothetical protein
MADISAPYNEIIRRRIEGAGVPQTKGGALAQGLGMVPQKVQGTTLEELQKNSLNNVFGFPEIGMKEIYQAGLGLGQKVTEGLGMFSGEGGRLPAPMLDAALSATKYLTSPSAAAKAIADEGIIDNSIFEATDLPNITFERKPGESRDDFKDRFLETDPKFEKGKTKTTPGTSGRNKGTPARDGASDEARAQDMIIAKRKEQELADANREASLDMPSMSDDPAEQLFAQAMTDYISQAREGAEGQLPKVGDIEAYKKKFAEATGIDISGKPDTSQALMAMGLSMMQNRAGKGFNVGKMLSAVGEAGEKALPALTAAKAEARANQVAAGKYALDMESKDETKREAAKKEMSALGQYFILPKGDGVAGSVSSILNNKGSYETISKGELQQLMKNPEFASKYDVLPGSMYKEIITEAMKTPEAEENWLTKTPRSRQLMAGVTDPIFNIEVFVGKPGGKKEGQAMVADQGQVQNAYRALAAMDRDNERLKQKFVDAKYLVEESGAVDVASAIIDNTDSFLSAFGINFRKDATDIEKLDYIMRDLQAGNASRILGESGKTISDGDRALVNEIVGNRTLLSNRDEMSMKLNKLFTSLYTTANNQVLDGLTNLDAISGQNVAGYLTAEEPLTEEEQKELGVLLGGSLAAPKYKTS